MTSLLDKIIAHKYKEVEYGKQCHSVNELREQAESLPRGRALYQSLKTQVDKGNNAVIAEIKKASPSKGVIRENFDPVAIAQSYASAGATCLSILTDKTFFQGDNQYLQSVHEQVDLPILRKDFMVDEWQIYQSKIIGADCVLLIVAALSPEQLNKLNQVAQSLSMDVIVEVHSLEELRIAESIGADIIGVNNRNLHDFKVSLNITMDLYAQSQSDALFVSESGISRLEDIQLLNSIGVRSFLVGEHFMRAREPGAALRQLFSTIESEE